MLRTLHVQNFVLIEDQSLDYDPQGYAAFTGETGAGKSLLVDALSLLLGARAQKEWVRHGAKEAVVEATFDVSVQPKVLAGCEAQGYPVDDGELLVRRVVSADGRSKVFIGGRLSSVSELAALTAQLVAICGQNAQYELTHEDAALEAIDRYAKTELLRGKFSEAFLAHRAVLVRRDALAASEAQRLQRLDYVAFQLKELEDANVVAGEEAALKIDRNRLAHAEKLRQGLGISVAALLSDDESALSRIGIARKTVRELSKLDGSLDAFAQRLDSTQIELDDLARSLERHLGDGHADPNELDRLESRLAMLSRLAKKHGCAPDELTQKMQSLADEKHVLSHADEERALLDAELLAREKELEKLGAELSRARKKGAEKFAREVSEALRPLAMPKAQFFVRVEVASSLAEATANGFDRVVYEIVTNAGEPQRPLAKVASGGELSRISLAIQSVLGDHSDVPTFIFDEVDAGIGGATAEIVAQTLATLGERRQVLCVTHLAQVAAKADKHYRVEKSTNAGRTISVVAELKGKARSEELARMLGGVQITDAVRKHAAELLKARVMNA